MERNIKLSEQTEILLNAILDLESLTNRVYSYVRETFSKDDSPEDETGQDILTASSNMREVLDHYLTDQINTSMMMSSNMGQEAVI